MAWWSRKKTEKEVRTFAAPVRNERPLSPEFKAWLDAGKPGDFKDFENELNAERAASNPMGQRFHRLRAEASGALAVDTTSRQGPCENAMKNLHGRAVATRASNAQTRFALRLNEESGRVEVKDDRYLVGFLTPEGVEAFVSVAGAEKVWVFGRLRYRPDGDPKFTADFDFSVDHEGTPVR